MTRRALLFVGFVGTPVLFGGSLAGSEDGPGVLNGDSNGDLKRDITDAVYLLNHLFLGGPAPVELASCGEGEPAPVRNGDTNGDGLLDVSDAVRFLDWLYSSGPEPVSPCGQLRGSGASATSTTVPLTRSAFVSCANGGLGEVVRLEGNLHLVNAMTFDENGGFHLQTHAQPQRVTGVGEVTGDTYQGTGVTRTAENTISGAGLPFETTFVSNFGVIGQGPENNFLAHTTIHMTIDANGDITADVSTVRFECR